MFQMKDLLKLHMKIDMDLLERTCSVLKVFKDTTVFMSSQSAVCVSLLKPLLHKLMLVSKPLSDSSDPTVLHDAKARLYHDLEKR